MIKAKVQQLCLAHGTTIKALEEALGLSKSSIVKWDKVSPKAENLQKVADYFNVSVDYLLGRPESVPTNAKEVKSEIQGIYDLLTPEQQEELMEFAKFKASQNEAKNKVPPVMSA